MLRILALKVSNVLRYGNVLDLKRVKDKVC